MRYEEPKLETIIVKDEEVFTDITISTVDPIDPDPGTDFDSQKLL